MKTYSLIDVNPEQGDVTFETGLSYRMAKESISHYEDRYGVTPKIVEDPQTVEEQIEFTRVNNDVNGNPRYVCHFLNLLSDKDEFTSIDQRYALALKRAKQLGGRKFHNKQYGGGIVFQSYNVCELGKSIVELVKNLKA